MQTNKQTNKQTRGHPISAQLIYSLNMHGSVFSVVIVKELHINYLCFASLKDKPHG
jgi:hypothetical protein